MYDPYSSDCFIVTNLFNEQQITSCVTREN